MVLFCGFCPGSVPAVVALGWGVKVQQKWSRGKLFK